MSSGSYSAICVNGCQTCSRSQRLRSSADGGMRSPFHQHFFTQRYAQHGLGALADDRQFQTAALAQNGHQRESLFLMIGRINSHRLVLVAGHFHSVAPRHALQAVVRNVRDHVSRRTVRGDFSFDLARHFGCSPRRKSGRIVRISQAWENPQLAASSPNRRMVPSVMAQSILNAMNRNALIVALVTLLIGASWCAAEEGRREVRAVNKETGQPVAARMHLKDQRGKPVKPPKVPYWNDHFVFDGVIALELPLGTYTFELECGPEFKLNTGYFTLERNANDTKTIEVQRFVDMKKEGWWSGELHIHRPVEEVELHMRAEDLHIGPVMTWWNNRNQWQGKALPNNPLVKFNGDRFYQLMAGEDEREGGALLYFNLREPLPIAGSQREYPSPVKFLDQARQSDGVHVDVEKPFWWDMPVWVATGKIDSMGLANNHEHRDGMMDREAWGKPRDTARFPSPHGNGQWSQHIYYQLLNCGLRIPPSAGSASGVLPNLVGYNRVYVHCGPELTWDDWWENLRRGQVVVTNGPMLRPRVSGPGAPPEGALPGHVFRGDKGKELELNIALNLSTRDPIDYLEVVK